MDGKVANAAIKELKAIRKGNIRDEKFRKEWEAEAKALTDISELRHDHLIQVKAIISKGKRQYFMFQWADGGSLRDFFENHNGFISQELVGQVIRQLLGLAKALDALHNWDDGDGSYRHGDLKPENILRFEDGTKTGTWKIADMGLAKHHFARTGARGGPTSTRNGTPLYEPPEAVTNSATARSRLYDIWSLGCITLEVLVWLLDGYEALVVFNNSLKSPTGAPAPYWELDATGAPRVHHKVSARISSMERRLDKSEPTALAALLSIVKTRLLVVALPANRYQTAKLMNKDAFKTLEHPRGSRSHSQNPEPMIHRQVPDVRLEPESPPSDQKRVVGPRRATAGELWDALQEIQNAGRDDPKYWLPTLMRQSRAGDMGHSYALPHTNGASPSHLPVPSSNRRVEGLAPPARKDDVGSTGSHICLKDASLT